jgi:hypothetical protein
MAKNNPNKDAPVSNTQLIPVSKLFISAEKTVLSKVSGAAADDCSEPVA